MAYIVICADGYFGDHAEIFSRHETLADAIAACKKRDPYVAKVTTDGGFADSHQPKMTIHRQHYRQYETVWSQRMEDEEKADAEHGKEIDAYEMNIRKKFGDGTPAYFRWMEHPSNPANRWPK